MIGDLGNYYERIAVSLGFLALLAVLATFASCRTFMATLGRFTHSKPLDNKTYQAFYKYHAYYWWTFITVLIIHVMSATIHTELLPAPGDPDGLAHWLILGFAFGTLAAISLQFASCRTFLNLIDLCAGKSSLQNKIYKGFYRLHSDYWWIFFFAIAGHVIAAAIHTDIWPR